MTLCAGALPSDTCHFYALGSVLFGDGRVILGVERRSLSSLRLVVMEPVAGYTQLGEQRIAFQVIGDGPVDLLVTAGFWGSFDVEWENPTVRLFYQRLAGFARVIKFDRRGTGGSDPLPLDALPPWEAFAEEIEAVLDAVDSEQAALMALVDAGPAGLLFASTRPNRKRRHNVALRLRRRHEARRRDLRGRDRCPDGER